MPKAWLLALPLLLVSSTAVAAEVAYVDLQRAVNECSEGKKAIAELQADETARQKAKADFDAAKAAAVKAKKPAPPAIPSDEQWTKQMQQRQATATNALLARMKRIFPAIAKARKLSGLASAQSMVYVPPALDVTAELVRRLDAGEGRDEVAAAPDLKAENAALKARLAAIEKRKGAPKSDVAAIPNLDPRAMTATTHPAP